MIELHMKGNVFAFDNIEQVCEFANSCKMPKSCAHEDDIPKDFINKVMKAKKESLLSHKKSIEDGIDTYLEMLTEVRREIELFDYYWNEDD